MKVSDLMTRSVAAVRKSDALSHAAKLMWDCDCGALPVLDEQGDRVIGMVTDRDICMATWSRNAAPEALEVSDAMSQQAYTCASNDTLATAEDLMRRQQIRRLPVVDMDQRLVGILSLADIARQSERAQTHRPRELSPREVSLTLAEICQSSRMASRALDSRI